MFGCLGWHTCCEISCCLLLIFLCFLFFFLHISVPTGTHTENFLIIAICCYSLLSFIIVICYLLVFLFLVYFTFLVDTVKDEEEQHEEVVCSHAGVPVRQDQEQPGHCAL